MRQLLQVLQVPLLDVAKRVPFPNAVTPSFFQEVKVVKIIFKTMDYFNELFSCYINNTVVVIAAAKHVEDDMADVPALTPICNF